MKKTKNCLTSNNRQQDNRTTEQQDNRTTGQQDNYTTYYLPL